MAAVFMALLAATIGERISPQGGRLLLFPLLAAGVASVLYWRVSDDLRLYMLVQFYAFAAVPLMLGWGEGAALAAAAFAAISANVIRAMRGTDNAPTIFFFFCLAGLPVVLPFALDPWPGGLVPWAMATAMALSAFAAQVLMTEAYGALSVGEAAAWLQLTPIAQVLLAALLLGETVTAVGMVGVALSVAGVAWATALGQRAAAAPPP